MKILLDCDIEIRVAKNGWIVSAVLPRDMLIVSQELRVFQTFAELRSFLEQHFSHREGAIEPDKE